MKNNTKKQDIIKAYAKVIETKGIEGASLVAVAKAGGDASVAGGNCRSKPTVETGTQCRKGRGTNRLTGIEAAWRTSGSSRLGTFLP